MTTATTIDELNPLESESLGTQLSNIRQQKGFTIEYIASQLHLRVRIIELIEGGQFNLLPEPVFIKGYIRAYCKLLGISPEPFLAIYNTQFNFEKKTERALWQTKKESNKAEHVIRWVTILFALGVTIAVSMWWQNNKDTATQLSANETTTSTELSLGPQAVAPDVKLDDLSKVEELIHPQTQMSAMETVNG